MEHTTNEVSLDFTLTKALQMLAPTIKKKRRLHYLNEAKQTFNLADDMTAVSLFHCCHNYSSTLLAYVQQRFQIVLLVVLTFLRKGHRITKLLFDGRHAFQNQHNDLVLHCFALNKNKALHLYTKDPDQLPPLHAAYLTKQHCSVSPLIMLLELDSLPLMLPSDPQNKQDLIIFLQMYTPSQTKVCITYDYGSKQTCSSIWYETPTTPGIPFKKVLFVRAFSNQHYNVVYAKDLEAQDSKRNIKRSKNINATYERYQTMWKIVKEKEMEESNPYQQCRTSSVGLVRTGLNLAYDLGIIKTKKELLYLSEALAKTQSSLFVFLDDQHHLRFVTYYDVEKTFGTQVVCFQNDCQDLDSDLPPQIQKDEHQRREKAAQTMLSFWTNVWERRRRWIERRNYLLKNVIDQLEMYAIHQQGASKPMQSPFLRCLADFKSIIFQQRVYMYSSQDTHLHAIKFYLADFAHHTIPRCRGVLVKAQGDSTLTTLSIPGLTVVNLYNYFDGNDDTFFISSTPPHYNSNIVCGPKPSEVFIVHTQRDLGQHHCLSALTKNDKRITIYSYCKEKGQEWSKHILQYWTKFGLYLLNTFNHEVHGQINYSSASYLGFQCLWTSYTCLAGPLAHAIEKTKPFYEDLIRKASKGGFMYSIEDAMEKGQPLDDTSFGHLAQSIAEMDLTSAYGYAASQAMMPSGFCTGFRMSQDGQFMERLDIIGRRHRSFEFRAVYKTILDLVQKEHGSIRTVYSNFSPFGLFCLGPYPIDLAIITNHGQLLLFQMDGAYCHGCPICPARSRYLNGQTHEQVREMTNKRDVTTRYWMDQINAKASLIQYTIIQDCCTPGYSSTSLEATFKTVPELANLIKGYHITDELHNGCLVSELISKLTNPNSMDFTYIAQANITITDASVPEPLIVYEPRPETYTRQYLAHEGSVVLTRDYLQWLVAMYGESLIVASLDWILFYSIEPIWNDLFKKLTHWRSTTKEPVLVSFLKRIINLTCGFFGARTTQQDKTTYRLVNNLPYNYAFYRHFPDINYTMDVGNNSYFLLETKPWPKYYNYRKASKSALPMFLTVVEYGKLRLVQILHYIQQHTTPGHFKLLYSNIDNIIFALAHADTLEDAVQTDARSRFNASKHLYLTSSEPDAIKLPGMAELKWIRKGDVDWKFITIRTQHYCLVVSETEHHDNVHKTSGWSNLSSLEAYQAAKNILNGNKVNIMQTRRINKKSNMLTHQVQFTY